MRKELTNNIIIMTILALSFFSFIFLGIEYMFDNMMAYVTDSQGVVMAQSYILGISVIGFLLFPLIQRKVGKNTKYMMAFVGVILLIMGIFVIQQHMSYAAILISGCMVFLLLGIVGSAVHYMASCVLNKSRNLSKIIGISYALGILFQFINNNCVKNDMAESIVLSVSMAILVILMAILEKHSFDKAESTEKEKEKNTYVLKNPIVAGIMLIIIVALMTCIFAALDNAVTLVHATGSVDIGQWPRLLLALSGLMAGFLFDIMERRYMNIMMYCVTLLSTACVVIIEFGGSFLLGLTVFYLSAGFFVVFFTTGFIDLSYHMNVPELWAGLGRAVNNACAVITGAVSVSLLTNGNTMVIMIVALVIFALISVVIYVYTNQLEVHIVDSEEERKTKAEEDAEKYAHFSAAYSLTKREQEVLEMMLSSDAGVQEMADALFISRAALYRHIGSLNEKTETKSRIGLIQFYYGWDEKKRQM